MNGCVAWVPAYLGFREVEKGKLLGLLCLGDVHAVLPHSTNLKLLLLRLLLFREVKALGPWAKDES